ncbi:MORN motif protein (macronuclear) [Tetrahymena thermophila SB210]|uniref:MORN motif protein n=1 Tax=Tetrahymena thermophila (strain SB210) TaxID=312017 RepID=I7MGS1_TETTS|nr:MORN motif protein [Tetrahymena thermophila SB210]EAS01961.2 MORN motif protein [Tetrahymena thermophila SB210]|eukprot:XP_001022206.2 MORN motif protein [Tetrahymena thermophila SB210]
MRNLRGKIQTFYSKEGLKSKEYKTGIYQGEYKNQKGNLREGKGVFYWYGGQIYIGQWQNDQIEGYGRVYFPYGGQFIGFFKQNKACGIGIMTLRNQKIYAGN